MSAPHYPAGKGTTALLVVTALFVLAQLYLSIPLVGPVAADFGDTGTVFALTTAFGLFYAGGFLIWGPLSDHWGRKRLLVPGLLALAVATFACALTPNVVWLALLRAVQGLAAASFAPIALAYLSEAIPPQQRATAIGAMSTAFLVAGIGGQAMASSVALWWDWRLVFVISGTVLLGAGLMIRAWLAEADSDRPAVRLGARFAGLAQLAAQPRILMLCGAHVTLLFSFVAMYSALGAHLAGIGVDPARILALRTVGLPGMFVALAVGWIAARIGMAGTARAGLLLAATGLVVEAALASSLVGIAGGSLLFVTGVALTVPAMITLFITAAAPNRAGGMALNGFVLFVGASIGPLTLSTGLAFPVLLAGLAVLLVLAAGLVTLFVRAQARRETAA